jgi:predicted oxidoreductase
MSRRSRCGPVTTALVALACLITACTGDPMPIDADVIVIGGGIAGLSAALEASSNGAEVLIIETSSVPGGHAVKAGGLALVGTPLQERKGFNDSPDIAYEDLMAWGEDPDPDWVRLFAENARNEIHDWLTGFGIEFTILLDTPEDTVPRFHFAGGTAVNVVVPMLREAMVRDNLHFVMSTEAEKLAITETGIFSIRTHHTRTGAYRDYAAPAVVIATGGFQSNLDLVRDNFRAHDSGHSGAPEHLLIGSGRYATGAGIRLGQAAGAQLIRMDRQVTFINGLPDPRDPQRGLHVENPVAIRVDANGRRFVDESAHAKIIESAVMSLDQRMHWLVFDDQGRKKLRIRGAVWLNRDTIASEILGNPDVMHKADSIAALAASAGLPVDPLQATINRYNTFVANGEDMDFGRFDPVLNKAQPQAKAITEPPFYAVQLLPMTRKSMGGLAIDINAQVIGPADRPVDGLFAAGEATGVAGINGSHGGSGTFLAPSVLTGRIAGRNAAVSAKNANTVMTIPDNALEKPPTDTAGQFPLMAAESMRSLIRSKRAGYWHWDRSHETVLERALDCTDCHSNSWPTMPAVTTNQQLLKLETCAHCH